MAGARGEQPFPRRMPAGTIPDCLLQLIDPGTEGDRKQQLEAELREYCKLDTLALVRLARFLTSAGLKK